MDPGIEWMRTSGNMTNKFSSKKQQYRDLLRGKILIIYKTERAEVVEVNPINTFIALYKGLSKKKDNSYYAQIYDMLHAFYTGSGKKDLQDEISLTTASWIYSTYMSNLFPMALSFPW
jgi:hypothetical protein